MPMFTWGRVAVALATACAFSFTSACGTAGDTAAGTERKGGLIEKAKATGRMTIGVKADQPGLALRTPDGYQGYDINIAEIIAAGFGVKPENIDWKTTVSLNREPFIQQGVVDLIVASYTINDARKKLVSFGGPYYVAGQDLLVQADSSITGPGDMAGQIACSAAGTTPAKRMEVDYPDVQLQLFDTYSKCVTALRGGFGVEAVTTDDVILAGYAAQPQNVGRFKIVGQPFSTEPYGIALKKEDVSACNLVNETLVAAAANGTYDAAFTESLGPSGLAPPVLDPSQLTNCPDL